MIQIYPIQDLDSFYTGEMVSHFGKEYAVLQTEDLIDVFGDDNHCVYGKKTAPTLIRRAILGEEIDTFTKNASGEYVPELHNIAKEGQYICQNTNDSRDTFICQERSIEKEYDLGTEHIDDIFKPFMRKSKPFKLLVGIIQRPTVITVKQRGNAKQFLDVGATLKLKENEHGKEVVGINAGGFEAWSILEKDSI